MSKTHKRLLSWVLSLIMMISVLPVPAAYADTTDNVAKAKVGNTEYTTLAAAFKAAKEGDTVTLLSDVTITENKAGIQIPDGVTFDGNNNTVTLACYTGSYTTLAHFWNVNADANVTIQNINFTYNEDLSGDALAFADATLNKVNVTMNGGRFALTVSNKEGAEINLNACTFTDNVGNYNISTDSGELTALKINRCTFNAKDYSLILRNSDSSVKNSTFNGKLNLLADDVAQNVTGNTFNARVKLYTNGETLTGNSFGTNGYVAIDGGTLTGINVSGNYWGGDAPTADQVPAGVTCNSYYTELNTDGTINTDSLKTVAPEVTYVAKVGDVTYTDIQEAIKAAAPNGTVEVLADVTVDEWIMFAQNLSIGNGNLITINMDGLTINGNGHTLTVNSIESADNGNRLFYDAQNLNINDLTIKYMDAAANQGGIGLQSGTISKVTFDGGVGVLPGTGDITITGCTFNTNGSAIYNEGDRDNLEVTGNTFNTAAGQYAIYLRGDVKFTNNTIINGKVNVVNGSPVVTGNNFGNERFKVYNGATATITGNTINNLVFNDATAAKSTFSGNELSDGAKAALAAVTPVPVYVAQIGSTKYETLAAAIAAANAGDTITLLADVTEAVTVNKSITVDGGNFKYTGNISVEGSTVDITIKNVNFENGTGYAVTTNRIKSVKIENCTVKNYGYGFLYANKSTPTVVVKNVTVEGGNYGFHWVYGTTATLENVTMTNVTNGLYIQNYAGKTVNLKNCNISSIAIWERAGYSGVQTFKFEGSNTVGTLGNSEYAKYVLAAADATLTAPEGATVTTTVADSKVVYENGTYKVVEIVYVAQVGETYYATLADAINAANGKTVTLLANIELTEGVTVPAGKTITLDLNGKTVSMSVAATTTSALITNNGTLTIKDSAENGKLTYVSSTVSTSYSTSTIINNGTLTVESGIIENTSARGGAPYVIDNYNTLTVNGGEITATYTTAIRQVQSGSNDNTVTVTGGTISGDYAGLQVHVMSNAKKTTTKIEGGKFEGTYAFYTTFYNIVDSSNTKIEVSGGTFEGDVYLDNNNNGSTNLNVSITGGTFLNWIFVYTKDEDGKQVPVKAITGGTFNIDPSLEIPDPPYNHYNYVADDYIAVDNGDDTWTVRKANYVAQVGETKYESLQAAINAADGKTVTLLADIELTEGVTVPAGLTVTLDLNGKKLSGVNSAEKSSAVIENYGNLTIDDYATGGIITSFAQNYDTTNKPSYANNTINNYGTLTVKGGIIENASKGYACYAIDSDINSVTVIEGGIIRCVNDSHGDAIRLFARSTSADAKLEIRGGQVGTVWAQNPSQNKASDVKYDITIKDGANVGVVYLEPTANAKVSITGGVIENVVLYVVDSEKADRNASGFISGGTFNNPVAESFCAEGYIPVDNGDGTYGVMISPYVAQIGDTKYESLAAAIAAANAGDEIDLLRDCAESVVLLYKGVTLDLNGHTLTVDGVLVAVDGNHVIDSTNSTGLLKVEGQTSVVLAQNNKQLAVWNGTGYIFTDITFVQCVYGIPSTDSDQSVFYVQPKFENVAVMRLLKEKGDAELGLSIDVVVAWGDYSQKFSCNDALVKNIYTQICNGNDDFSFKLTINGTASLAEEGFTIQTSVSSDTHVIVSATAMNGTKQDKITETTKINKEN